MSVHCSRSLRSSRHSSRSPSSYWKERAPPMAVLGKQYSITCSYVNFALCCGQSSTQASRLLRKDRHRTLPELRRRFEDHRPFESQDRDRKSAGDCQNPQPSGPADPRPRLVESIYSRPSDSRIPPANASPDGAARSEFDRAAP
jgi:hypothetical protein